MAAVGRSADRRRAGVTPGEERDGTIFALSSGGLPAAIAVVRISGTRAGEALHALAGRVPAPRQATHMALRDAESRLLDRALILWMPGPGTATGEDVVELHLHGGRATTGAVLAMLGAMPGLQPAEAGAFTRRALLNGRMDLTEVEGLADLLLAETEQQRRGALRVAEGALAREVMGWRARLLAASAEVEAAIEFAEDAGERFSDMSKVLERVRSLQSDLASMADAPPAERLRDGVRIIVAGPTNAGKSSLINRLAGRDVAIATAIEGTTRDLIEVPLQIDGVVCVLIDSAGLRKAADEVERIGIARTRQAMATADILLWLGSAGACPPVSNRIVLHARADLPGRSNLPPGADLSVSSVTGEGLDALKRMLVEEARQMLPATEAIALNQRQRTILTTAAALLSETSDANDELILAESLRAARVELDRISGLTGTEEMLDALFGQFCVGK